MSLKDISTKEIVKELESRIGVRMFLDEIYQEGYNINIVKKYSKDRTPIELPTDITVLVIDNSFNKVPFDEFLKSTLGCGQANLLKKVLKENIRTVYFHGNGIGKSTLANVLKSLGYNAIGHCENEKEEIEILNDTKKYISFCMDKKRPVMLIPDMYKQLLEQKESILKWITS